MKTIKFKFHLFLELIAVSLLLSACRAVVETNVNLDGSGELRTSIVYTAEEKKNFEQTPGNESKSICDNLRKDVPSDATFTEEIRDQETYCVTSRRFSNISELRQLYARMNNVTVNELKLEIGRLTFDVNVDLTSAQEGQGIADEWRLTLPGTITENNAGQVDGQTLIWTISPGDKVNLHAKSDVGLSLATLGPAGALILLACACGFVLLGGIGAFFLLRRRK
jgi:phosphatidylinositol mannoside-binding LppM-like protein